MIYFFNFAKIKLDTLKTGKLKKAYFLFLFLGSSILFFSCNKESDLIGLNIQPPSDLLNALFFDSTSVIAFSVFEDSLRTDELSQNVLGYLNDFTMGSTQAGFGFQIVPSSRNVKFGTNPELDSAFLMIGYRGYLGDTNNMVDLRLYEIDQDLYLDSNYYSYSNINCIEKNLIEGKSYVIHRPGTTTIVNNVATLPNLKIPISKKWIMNRIFSKSDQPELSDNTSFINYMKGLYLTAIRSDRKGNMVSLDLKSTVSGLVLYYHNDEADSLKYTFVVNDKCARVSNFNHFGFANASSHFRNQLFNNDTISGNEMVYLKPLAGTNVRIKFPYLKQSFLNKRVVINKAELVLTSLIDDYGSYYVPPKLLLSKNKSDGGSAYLPDDAVYQGEAYFGGDFNTTTKEYRFRITKYVQQLLSSTEPDYGLTLFVSGRAVRANSVVIVGNNPPTSSVSKRLRLEITYSLLN